ncbi:MAG: glycosyltransferase family 4 protein [Mucilaginibacter polytrichastri]|nr:glycosyltransferase family 4 protein [Mucilaginibacter polytrichastri]
MSTIATQKLTIDARMLKDSGIGVYIQRVLEELSKADIGFDVLVKSKDADHVKRTYHGAGTCRVFDANIYSVKELLQLSGETKGSHMFWSPHYNVPFINHASGLKITTIHDVYHLAYYQTLSWKQKLYAKFMLAHAVRSSDLVFTVSHFSKSEILKFIRCDPEKIHVVHNGVDAGHYRSARPLDPAKYGTESPYVLFVGNVKPHKNLKSALRGFKIYSETLKKPEDLLDFIIVGKREGFITGDDEVLQMLEQPFYRRHVRFTGWVDDEDLPAIYKNAALFVFPSLYEGFGFPPLEAMAAGCPVISSDAACMPEIYEDAVLYFNPQDENAIAESMKKVLSDKNLNDALRERGFDQVKKYNWTEAARSMLDIIKTQANRLK